MSQKLMVIISTAIIFVLILAYIPLRGFLFSKHITIYYDFFSCTQYDDPGGDRIPAEKADIVYLGEEGSVSVTGLVLQKRYTEVVLDTQGVPLKTVDISVEYSGKPEQLWLHAGEIFPRSIYSSPLFVKNFEEGQWKRIKEGEFSLYQKGERFSDLSSFYSSIENIKEDVGLAGLSPGEVVSLALAGKERKKRGILNTPLRGAHILELIVNKDRLDLDILKRDLNREQGVDDVVVQVRDEKQTIFQYTIPDDGNSSDDGRLAARRQEASINIGGLKPGKYTVEISSWSGNDDFMIEGIKTDAVKCVFRDSVTLLGSVGKEGESRSGAVLPAKIYLDSPEGELSVDALEPSLRSSIFIGREKLITLGPMQRQKVVGEASAQVAEGVKELYIDNPENLALKFRGGGFSFSRQDLFNPSFSHFRMLNDSVPEELSVILAKDYEQPEEAAGKWRSEKSIEICGYKFPGEKMRFVFEKIGDEPVLISSLKVVLNE